MRVWTDRAVWEADNPALAMMAKVRLVINTNAFEHCLDLESVTAKAFVQFDWPWVLLWHSFENEVNNARLLASKLSIDKMKGHISRSQASRDKKWERGTPFANGPGLRYAKLAVMAEIEKRSEKNTCRGRCV